MRTALIVGATGLVGSHCLDLLLADERYDRVTVLARRPLERRHTRLDLRVVDFDTLGPADVPAVDDVFCALGTTIKVAGSQQAFYRVDHDYPVEVARLAGQAGARRFALVSSVGADPGARNFYLRVKGKTERDITALVAAPGQQAATKAPAYDTVEIFRPSLLLGERSERRPVERVLFGLWRLGSPVLIGPAGRYRAIPAATVAAAMKNALLTGQHGTHVRHYPEIVRLAG